MTAVAAVARPPYVVPSMLEVRLTRSCGLTVVSTFSGAGGSCLGFRMAGYRTLWASEFVPAAADTYRANFPDVPLSTADIRSVTGADVRAAIGDVDVDVLEGSPPCASFSMSGRRDRGWSEVRKYSDVKQRVDDLFFEFARVLGELRPRAFVAENVVGLVRGRAVGVFKAVMAALRSKGYVVAARVLDAWWYGVPQRRQRVIIVGVRDDDLRRQPVFPDPMPWRYSLADALPELDGAAVVRPERGSKTTWARRVVLSSTGPSPTVQAHGIGGAAPHQVLIDGYAIGREARSLAPGGKSGRYLNLMRADPWRPCPTVTATGSNPGAASVVHPTELRKFTVTELKRICGFPDDFVLTGSPAQQWERLGRAVPPPFAAAIAAALRDRVLRREG